jgi:hypothetical protein
MVKVVGKITFDPRPLKVGAQWQIVATCPNGQQEHITGFRSEVDAEHWITNGFKAWLKNRCSENEQPSQTPRDPKQLAKLIGDIATSEVWSHQSAARSRGRLR